jgi:hypothetical protein
MPIKVTFEKGKTTQGPGFDWNTALQVESAKHIKFIQRFVKELAANPNRCNLKTKWFNNADTVRLQNMWTNLDKYLNTRCTRITLVSLPGTAYGAIWYEPTVFGFEDDETDSKKMWGKDIKTNTKSSFQEPNGFLQLPTGIRIQVQGAYLNPPDKPGNDGLDQMDTGRINTIFHEMTHRILQTIDFKVGNITCYGYDICKELAKYSAQNALQNADNWGYFLADYYKNGDSFR